MAKKAKVSVRGYFKDLMGWFGLMKARQAWIDAGDPNIDTTDNAAKLAKELIGDDPELSGWPALREKVDRIRYEGSRMEN